MSSVTDKIDLEALASSIARIGAQKVNEEKLKLEVEKLLSKFLGGQAVNIDPSYEYTFISGERVDALYGHVIIEYEKPGAVAKKSLRNHAIGQVKKYIQQAGKSEENFHKFFGVVLDGRQIVFVRFISSKGSWSISKPVDVNVGSIRRLVEAIKALNKKPLDADLMISEFGPSGKIVLPMVKLLYELKMKSARSETLYKDWRRVFQQVAGYSLPAMKGLEDVYSMGDDVSYEKLLFSIHTYYALLMKLIAAELVVLYGGGKFVQSFLDSLLEAESKGQLKDRLNEVESGSLFESLDFLNNFVEGDYFSWYLNEWNEPIHKKVVELITAVSAYEVGTTDLEPERVRDLFKSLYQNLIPREVRLKMGEFYTPDWLAELTLDTAGFTLEHFNSEAEKAGNSSAPLELRFLDPACGSGTFLLQAIGRVRQYAEEHFIDERELAEKIITNIVGYDLNPLAVIAARTNYLLALGDLIRYMKGREIPVFLADSIMVEEKSTLRGRNLILRTAVGDFAVPAGVIEKGLLNKILSLVGDYMARGYPVKDFNDRLRLDAENLDEQERETIGEFYELFLKLERDKKDRIWAGIIKNSFAPLYKGTFDYVIGNPPWISWDNLPGRYRTTLEDVWDGLWSSLELGNNSSEAAFKKDISALFTAYCFAKYRKEDGLLAFLVTFTLFKAQSGGNFRRFLANATKVDVIHDLVSLKPFEGATNRTSMLLLRKGKTKFPIDAVSWKTKKGTIDFRSSLAQVRKETKRAKLIMEPIEGLSSPQSSWLMVKDGAQTPLRKAIGPSVLVAQEGINTRGANGVFYVNILDEKDNLVLVENMSEEGRRDTEQKQFWVEQELVYPLLRGKDVERWSSAPSNYIVVPVNPTTGETYLDSDLRVRFPNAWRFLLHFKDELNDRTHYGEPISKSGTPFYTLFQVNKKAFAPYKVVWKEISGEISGKGDFAATVVGQTRMGIDSVRKPPLADHKLMMIPFDSEDEAYFTAAVLNSSVSRLIVASYTIETSISTHVLKHVRVPEYDNTKGNMRTLANLAKQLHKKPDAVSVSHEIDTRVAEMFGISVREMQPIRESLKVLL